MVCDRRRTEMEGDNFGVTDIKASVEARKEGREAERGSVLESPFPLPPPSIEDLRLLLQPLGKV